VSIKSKLKKSRNNWKGKAGTRGTNLRYLRKENFRIKQERDRYKKEARETKKKFEEDFRKKASSVCSKVELVYISLSLFLDARISFRAIPGVLAVLNDYLGGDKNTKPPDNY
jgi:predicted transcriptional regulator